MIFSLLRLRKTQGRFSIIKGLFSKMYHFLAFCTQKRAFWAQNPLKLYFCVGKIAETIVSVIQKIKIQFV